MFNLPLHGKVDPACTGLVQVGDTIEAPFCCMRRAYCCFPPTLTDYSFHLFIYVILHCRIELLREEFQPLYGGGPFTADKNSKYKHAPIRELAANQPLPQRDLCYLQSGLGLGLSDSLQGPMQKTLR